MISVRGHFSQDYFWTRIHPRIHQPYVLITMHEEVAETPEHRRALPGQHAHRLNDTTVSSWFTLNNDGSVKHPKLHTIPIGLLWRFPAG